MTAVIIIAIALVCAVLFAGQSMPLILLQEQFAAEHPDYVSHSWYLLGLLLATAALAAGSRRSGSKALVWAASAGTIVLAVLALLAAADQLYYMGILRDQGIEVLFEADWLLLVLTAVLILAAVVQFLILVFSALAKSSEN